MGNKMKYYVILIVLLPLIVFAQDYEAKSGSKRMRIVKNPPIVNFEVSYNKPVSNNILKAGEINDFVISITNKGTGVAKDVYIDLTSTDFDRSVLKVVYTTKIGDVLVGETKDVTIPFTVSPDLNKPVNGMLKFKLTEKGEYDLTEKYFPIKIIPSTEQMAYEEEIILNSDVDKNIPITPYKRPNAIAVILTVSRYANKDIPPVKFAKHDGKALREYLIKTFGYDPDNILPKNENELITYGNMKNYIKNVLPNYIRQDGSSEIFIYFAGHGAPSVNNKKAYFVPYDADPNFVSDDNAYSMDAFYDDISALKASKKIVVIDACFSGSTGEGEVLVKDASSVLLDVDESIGTSIDDTNNIVMRSSTGQQVSNWYPEKNHSMFTYYLLKGLQGAADLNQDGTITLGEMKSFINDQDNGLPGMARRKYGRKQTPVISGDDNNILVRLR